MPKVKITITSLRAPSNPSNHCTSSLNSPNSLNSLGISSPSISISHSHSSSSNISSSPNSSNGISTSSSRNSPCTVSQTTKTGSPQATGFKEIPISTQCMGKLPPWPPRISTCRWEPTNTRQSPISKPPRFLSLATRKMMTTLEGSNREEAIPIRM